MRSGSEIWLVLRQKAQVWFTDPNFVRFRRSFIVNFSLSASFWDNFDQLGMLDPWDTGFKSCTNWEAGPLVVKIQSFIGKIIFLTSSQKVLV